MQFIKGSIGIGLLMIGLVACHSPGADDQSGTVDPQPTENLQNPTPQVEVHEEVVVTGMRKQGLASAADMSHAAAPAMYRVLSAPPYQDYGRDQYQVFKDNRWIFTKDQSVSTFASDVDTASYAILRRSLEEGILPPSDAVRIEELVNYFDYQYPAPSGDQPFGIYHEFGPSPWDADTKLLHIGINTTPPARIAELPPANLVFLVDVSGSMQAPNKIHLLKRALKLLTRQLRSQDRIALVVYAGAAGTALESTPGSQTSKILAAIDNLQAGGSTNGAAGIHLAYQIAEQHFIKNGINRVMLATDGDFNVGTTDTRALEKLVEKKRASGVALTVLGFGTGNLNDHMMQKIAQIGDGNAAYIDSMHEARKVLVDELGATLNIVARDVKIQVEFNPAVVEGYRLVGYETRHLNREDFNNDKVDAGDVGEGHAVTALYEIALVGNNGGLVDPLRYAKESVTNADKADRRQSVVPEEAGFIKVRYKARQGAASQLVTQVVPSASLVSSLDDTSERFRFSGAVAWFGQILRGNDAVHNDNWQQVLSIAQNAKGKDKMGYRSELIKLIRTAQSLQPEAQATDDVARR